MQWRMQKISTGIWELNKDATLDSKTVTDLQISRYLQNPEL